MPSALLNSSNNFTQSFGGLLLFPPKSSSAEQTVSQTREPPPPPPPRILRQMKGNLPEDIVLNILANLPVKSVIRFRCVSKTWDSSITTPHFISTHLSLNLNNNNLDHYHAHLIHLPTCTASSPSNGPVCMVARDSSTFNSISEYPIPSALHSSALRIVGSCNGLVCLAQYGYGSSIADAIYLWNPSIRKYKRLPDFSLTQNHWVSTGFAYQSETNDYKVVKISQMRAQNHHGVEVYTLSSNSWRRVEMSLGNNVAFNSGNCRPATFVNGVLHWLGEVKGGVQLANRDVILSFDVNNDKFGEIALLDGQQLIPQGLVAVPHDLMVFKGKLAFITFGYITTNRINVEEYIDFIKSHKHKSCFIWVMGEYGVHESWSKLFFVRFENACYANVYGCNSCGELLIRKEVMVSNADFNWIESVIVSLDPETLHEKDLGIRNISLLATTFMESLVLLDGAAELSG